MESKQQETQYAERHNVGPEQYYIHPYLAASGPTIGSYDIDAFRLIYSPTPCFQKLNLIAQIHVQKYIVLGMGGKEHSQ